MSWEEFSERFMVFGAAIGVHLIMAALIVVGTLRRLGRNAFKNY